jgi:hypothetical protein
MSMRLRRWPVVVLLALAAPALAGPSAPAPAGTVGIAVAGGSLTLWPYTTSDFETRSDPVNLVFPNADPRAIRQELVRLGGQRPGTPFAGLPFGAGACRWMDAMGYEQTAWAEPDEWVAGAVQLACVASPSHPLGSPFRFHARLFRVGAHTLGAAHFEILVPGTAEHEVLSWDFARQLVLYDVARTGTLTAAPTSVGLVPAGSFRAVRRPVHDGLVAAGLGPLFAALGLVPPASGDVPIPTSGQAAVLSTGIAFAPVQEKLEATAEVTYDIVAPKPFCASGPYDFVRLRGPLHFAQSVHTNPSGKYQRDYLLGGTLQVTPMIPTSPTTFVPAGPTIDASITETHRAMLTDEYDQVTERVAQVLLGEEPQSLEWTFGAGQWDRFVRSVVCEAP